MPNCINPSSQFNLLKLKMEKTKIEDYIYLFVSHYRIARLLVHPFRARSLPECLLFMQAVMGTRALESRLNARCGARDQNRA